MKKLARRRALNGLRMGKGSYRVTGPGETIGGEPQPEGLRGRGEGQEGYRCRRRRRRRRLRWRSSRVCSPLERKNRLFRRSRRMPERCIEVWNLFRRLSPSSPSRSLTCAKQVSSHGLPGVDGGLVAPPVAPGRAAEIPLRASGFAKCICKTVNSGYYPAESIAYTRLTDNLDLPPVPGISTRIQGSYPGPGYIAVRVEDGQYFFFYYRV